MNTNHSPISKKTSVIPNFQAEYNRKARQARSDYLAATAVTLGRLFRMTLLAVINRHKIRV